jgi:hypothetical protein
MKQSTIIVYITLAVLIAAAFLTGGRALVAEGLIISANTAYKSAVMLIASFIITGQLNVLLTMDVLESLFTFGKGSQINFTTVQLLHHLYSHP